MDINKIKPLSNKILIKLEEIATMTPGGLYIPEDAQKRKNGAAEVIAIGKEVSLVKVGDSVLIEKFKGMPIQSDEGQYVIIDIEYVECVLYK